MKNISVIKAIEARKSVRSYSGQPLKKEDADEVRSYISNLKAPFGAMARIEMMSANIGTEPVKLGTYGVISGVSDFLVLLYHDGPLAEEAAGYIFEQAVLRCTQLGLGTCWLGGTVNKKDFLNNLSVGDGEILPIVSPVGYPADKRRLLERVMRAGAGSDSRKSFSSIFFDKEFGSPLTEENAGQYRQPLEAVRLAPSASNTQPWRVVMRDENTLHFFYKEASKFSAIDMGIALCHFEMACRELNMGGHFEALGTGIPESAKEKYSVSWIGYKI